MIWSLLENTLAAVDLKKCKSARNVLTKFHRPQPAAASAVHLREASQLGLGLGPPNQPRYTLISRLIPFLYHFGFFEKSSS